ncbi:MAG: DNA gyrase subunit A [Culicoidibacterales bacterium]
MNVIYRSFSDIMNKEALDFAKYTIASRAFPSIMDGLKPSQRFFLYSAIKSASKEFKKVAAIGGCVSDYGYNHGEVSVVDAGARMANTWSNNYPILTGRGNFGSRMVQEAAASRYIFCKVDDNFNKLFKDNDILPVHPDASHIPPLFYLPVVPTVLLNGVDGIATGYSTSILPHSLESVVQCVKQVLADGTCDEPLIKFPDFNGDIVFNSEESYIQGKFQRVGKSSILITEIPVRYDREKYVTVLDALEQSGKVTSYDDECGENNFQFKVNLQRSLELTDDQIIKLFKLRQNISQNINVIDVNGNLKHYDKASDLIVDFVTMRSKFIETRISTQIHKTSEKLEIASERVAFIRKMVDNELCLKGMTRKECIAHLTTLEFKHPEILLGMSIYQMTDDEIAKLEKELVQTRKEHEFWKKTNVKKQFINDLEI